jgi:hypothetical protein
MKRVLFVGGYGLVGSHAVRTLRSFSNDLEILIAGRRPQMGDALAMEVGSAGTAFFDSEDASTCLEGLGSIDLVVSTVSDIGDKLALCALQRGIAHIGIARTSKDIAPFLMSASHSGSQASAAVCGHWQAGAMTLAAVDLARSLAFVDAVRMTAIFDPLDAVGPLAREDVKTFPDRAIVRASGEWAYVDRTSNASEVEFPDGTRFHCRPMDVLDVPSVALATGARDVSFAIGVGASLGRRRGSSPSHELHIEASGTQTDGSLARLVRLVSAPRGQGWLTGHTIGQAASRLLDLDGHGPTPSGPVWPETLLDCARFLQSLLAAGVEIQDFVFPKHAQNHDAGCLPRQ